MSGGTLYEKGMEEKGLRVNAGKTKVMICDTDMDLLQSSGEFSCCHTGEETTPSNFTAMAANTGYIRNAVYAGH